MGRAPRSFAAGGVYHVFSRGSNRFRIFFERSDFEAFLLQLGGIVEKYEWRLFAYCLLPNHYHLLVRIADGGLSNGMRDLNGGFSRRTSKKYGRVAHLFKNRFGVNWVVGEQEFLVAARYVVINPVRAGLCDHPEEWPWSSYRASAGSTEAPAWLDVPGLLEHFDVFAPGRPQEGYRNFVAHGLTPAAHLVAKSSSDAAVAGGRPQAGSPGPGRKPVPDTEPAV